MRDPALKSDRMQGILFPHPTTHMSYHRKMIEKMNQLIGFKLHSKRTSRPEYRHYLTTDESELQELLDQFRSR